MLRPLHAHSGRKIYRNLVEIQVARSDINTIGAIRISHYARIYKMQDVQNIVFVVILSLNL